MNPAGKQGVGRKTREEEVKRKNRVDGEKRRKNRSRKGRKNGSRKGRKRKIEREK